MKYFEKFLHENSSQTSLNCLIDSLENRKKTSLTFKDAVETVEKMAKYIEELEQKNEWLKAQLKEAKEFLHWSFSF